MNGQRISMGRVIAGTILIIVGVGWLLETSGIIDLPARVLGPVALIVIGVALVVGSRRGSYPALIVIGGVLALLMAIDSPADTRGVRGIQFGRFRSSVGEHVERPRTAADLHPYRIDAGQLTIDLTRLRLRERTYKVQARVGAGQIRVIVPAGVALRVEARSGVGNIDILGRERKSGLGTRQSFASQDFAEAMPRLELELRVGAGSIHVVRGASGRPFRDRVRFTDEPF